MFEYTVNYSELLEEKEILLTLLPFEQSVTLYFSKGTIQCFLGKSAKQPALSVSFTPSALLSVLLRQDKTKIKMQGDAVVGQALEQCFHDASMNWEEFINRLLGESFSYPVIMFLRKIHAMLRETQQKTKNHVADYLQEDTDTLPLASEVKDFCDEVDELRLRVDRLEALFNSK